MRVFKVATALVVAVFALALHLSRSPAVPSGAEAPLGAVDAIGITVQDLDRSVEFYSRVLFFEKVSDAELPGIRGRVVRMKLGDEFIELTEQFAAKATSIPGGSSRNDHPVPYVAIVVNDIDQVALWLRRHKVEPLAVRSGNAGGIRAFSFRDPDGHRLEIRQFPPGEGHPRWHYRSESVFLGIDHAAR